MRLGLSLALGRYARAGSSVATIASDTFTRADNPTVLGSTEVGGLAWVQPAGNYGIIGNQLYQSSALTNKIAVVNAGVADCTITVTIPVWDSTLASKGAGIAFRSTAGATLDYLEFIPDNGTGFQLAKAVAGAYTNLATGAFTPVNGDVMKVILLGTSIRVLQNGVQVVAVTDATGLTNTYHGVCMGIGSSLGRWDNFSITVP
jgi:hypothetical protein